MYSDATLTDYLQTSSAVATRSKVVAEWNLNTSENILAIGNYKNRPTSREDADNTLPNTWKFEDENTKIEDRDWYGFTNYDTVVDGGYENESQIPVTFQSANLRQESLLSLEDCFARFRPRSGINKLRLFGNKKMLVSGASTKRSDIFKRPRYYAAGPNDNFKYWSSYRKSGVYEIGISGTGNSPYLIDDAAPFVIYKNNVPTNKIVMKIQTNVGSVDNGRQISPESPANKDPYFIGSTTNYKSTPLKWKIQKYNGTNWVDIYTTESDVFTNPDGYFELSYGITNIPSKYTDNFNYLGTFASTSALPLIQDPQQVGQAYLVKSSDTAKGTFYIYNGLTSDVALTNYDSLVPTYGWYKSEESITNSKLLLTDLDKATAPSYLDGTNTLYREFEYIKGLRVVVNRMVNQSVTFDLIELSPRISADITDMTTSFSIKKYASDLGVSNLPVGQLLAASGSMSLIDYSEVFNLNSKTSILNVYSGDTLQLTFTNKNLQLKFYEVISQILQDNEEYKDFYIPLKTMYADGFPQYDDSNRNIEITLRDFTFFLESKIAPEILIEKVSISYAVASLLDSIGFSNYNFLRKNGVADQVIPYFMISPNKTIIQVLQELAIATQTTMFFDEVNNFIVMSKEYLVPDETRPTDITLYGSDDDGKKANILNISSQSNDIYNDGKITFYDRYIQRERNVLKKLEYLPKFQNEVYKKVVLWKLESTQNRTQTRNQQASEQSGYSLSAAPLNTNLTKDVPVVRNGVVRNNTLDVGDAAYWLSNYNGYLYSNGEIIKYDAIQFSLEIDNEITIPANQTPGLEIGGGTRSVTLATSSPHGLLLGDNIIISGIVPTTYRGEYFVTKIPSPTSFTITSLTGAGNITTAGKVSLSKVWVSSNQEYQRYFSQLSFGGKMYRTGLVKISAEPKYTTDGTALVEGDVAKHGRGQFGTKATDHYSGINDRGQREQGIDPAWRKVEQPLVSDYQYIFNRKPDTSNNERQYNIVNSVSEKIDDNKDFINEKLMPNPTTSIANFLSLPKNDLKTNQPIYSSQVQASALILTGPNFATDKNGKILVPESPPSCINYVKKDLSDRNTVFDTFGTRIRILGNSQGIDRTTKNGKPRTDPYYQAPIGPYSIFSEKTTKREFYASSGGIAIKTNDYGEGYYFEIAAIDYTNLAKQKTVSGADVEDIFFYKMEMKKDGFTTSAVDGTPATRGRLIANSTGTFTLPGNPMTPAVGKLLEIRSANKPEQNGLYIITKMGAQNEKWELTRTTPVLQPTVLYSGYHNNLTDSGIFVAKVKKIIDKEDSVYDLSVRMSIENNKRIFQIYLNNENIGAVTDPDPVARLNENVSLFTRGSSKIMFENVFALDTTGYDSINESSKDKSLFNIFNDSLTSNIEFNRYSLNNLLISGFLSRINANTANTNTVFYEEFGSIMREVGYINAKFNIYPALRSMVSPTPASLGGWFVTGYNSTPYRAEFLIFNTTDFVLTFGDNKDATSNLNISGITFTEEVANELTVDNYYNNMIQSSREQNSPTAATFKTNMTDIKNNRLAYGSKAFSIDSPYIQNQEMAEDLMSWIIEKVSKPRKAVAVQTFGMPIIQLGDIVDFYYDQTKTKPNGITGSRFVVYGIEHDTAENGPSTILYLSEVV